MNIVSTTWAVNCTAAPPVASASDAIDAAQAIHQAATRLLLFLEQGKAITTAALRIMVTDTFGGTDAQAFGVWKDPYEALEAAQVQFLRRFGLAILTRSSSHRMGLGIMKRVADLVPTHMRCSDESQAMQQLSAPLPLGFVAAHAAAICSSDLVFEPSAGTGLLVDIAPASLALNELAAMRS